ncbi:MAG: ferritin-like domain-containing protein [Verrucomicrobiales bacterium]
MTVRDFAERVLFSTDLAGKLDPVPGELSDNMRGRFAPAPRSPGRPSGLHLAVSGDERAEFPRQHQLRDERSRGQLLHFFANHELLATELMALALLKFPEAPSAFRRGLLHTLAEEQQHTQWYVERMRAYGIEFGDFPVNGFFWNAVADMASPLDYVARLPLTFEQANLDFSLHYRDVFLRAGDAETAALFERIHEDEIGHVAYGWRWFQKWKARNEDDFDALARRLAFPLSPAWAKGKLPLDIEGRRQAGLGDAFIRRLELFSRSRGRTPRVYLFNPGAEFQFAPQKKDRASEALARDVDLLPMALARREDILVVRQTPREAHLRKLRDAGFEVPEIEVLTAAGRLAEDSLTRRRKLGGLRPWAWAPDAAQILEPLASQVGGAERRPDCHEKTRQLYSKEFGAKILGQLGDPDAGVVISCLAALRSADAAIRSRGHREILLKPAFGLAGRGHRRVAEIGSEEEKWAAGYFAAHGQIVAEPWLDRVADFSAQCEVDSRGDLRLKGFTSLETTPAGRFIACSASAQFANLFRPEIARFFHGDGRGPWLRAFYEERVFPVLHPALRAVRFYGALGIDAFIHRDTEGVLHLRPVVEINPRFTMGRVAWEILRITAPHRKVRFSIATLATARVEGFRSLQEYAARLETTDPVVNATGPGPPKISTGTLILNDATRAHRFLAVLQVAKVSNPR